MVPTQRVSERWIAYLHAVRDEVSNNIVVFSEDDELRLLNVLRAAMS